MAGLEDAPAAPPDRDPARQGRVPAPPAPARPAPAVSLVVPCYQEEEALGPFAALLPTLLDDLGEAEALFVDDGSTDGTAGRLEALAAADPRVRVLRHPCNRGVGAAVRTGLAAARGAVRVVYDADATYPPGDVARLVAEVRGGADVAGATPLAPGGGLDGVPWARRLLTRAAAAAYRLALGPSAGRLTTFTCAFRAYGPRALPCVGPGEEGFGAAAEMLGRALLAGLRVVERPSVLRARSEGRSKLRLLRALPGHARVLLSLCARRARRRRGG